MSDTAGEEPEVRPGTSSSNVEPAAEGDAAQPKRRLSSKALLIGLVGLAGTFALLASVQVWVRIEFIPGVATVESLSVQGQKVSPALTLIALAALASALVLTIAGTTFRRVLGGLLAVLGGGLAAIGITVARTPIDGARGQIEVVTGISGDALYGLVEVGHATPWPGVTSVIGLVIAVIGVFVIAVSGRWKAGGRKYESGPPVTKRAARRDDESDRISDWEALSDGDDPTDYQ